MKFFVPLIPAPYAILLYTLLAAWAALLILGFAFGRLDEERINRSLVSIRYSRRPSW